MSQVVTLFNQAGGVGKSTLTFNLGYHLTQRNKKVLLVDMDPQGSLIPFLYQAALSLLFHLHCFSPIASISAIIIQARKSLG
ncbi:cobyrinic acid a,c-diamide synthase [Scytonema sp. HK-05]|nr:cobyrinic acid a,c-diamide synthase [Scytonema sp. HK-05]